jgi:hypothetical protein
MNNYERRNSFHGPRINMANLVIPPWRGGVYPTPILQLWRHLLLATSTSFYQHPSANTLYHQPGGNTFYQQPPANNLPFNPGPIRNPQASECAGLGPLEPHAALFPQNTGTHHEALSTKKTNMKNH